MNLPLEALYQREKQLQKSNSVFDVVISEEIKRSQKDLQANLTPAPSSDSFAFGSKDARARILLN